MFRSFLNLLKQNPVAWYGAIASTLSIIITFLKFLQDRPIIRINYSLGLLVNSPYHNPDKMYHSIKVTNIGKRPVKILQAGAKLFLGEKKKVIFSDSYAIKEERILNEINPTTYFFVEKELLDLKNIDYIWAEDAAGTIYKKYLHTLPVRIWKRLVAIFNK